MDTISEEPRTVDKVEHFTPVEFNTFLLQHGDRPRGQLPRTLDLSDYTSRIDAMYQVQIQKGELEDFSVPLDQRVKGKRKFIQVAGERTCTLYYDPETETTRFTPVVQGETEEVGREAFDLIRQSKLPLVEIHTHPKENFFSTNDLIPILMSFGRGRTRIMKAALLLLPSSQVLALASSETSKYDQNKLGQMLIEWQSSQKAAGDPLVQQATEDEKTNTGRLMRAGERLIKLAGSGRFTQDRIIKKMKDIENRANNHTNRQDSIDMSKSEQILNQGLLGFAISNGINLYFSTNKRDFLAFTA